MGSSLTRFPTTQHKGCLFHHTQAVWKKVQELGMVVLYRENIQIKKFVRILMALAFLPVVSVRPAFCQLRDSFLVQEHQQLRNLVQYVEETWLTMIPIPF
ncbi:hypothetical protein BaRGS_00020595 [Batillaria attramentaria]|uniref:MULE transposase domain-containing protein n=1 Tax=Batillaria attramentaria TaxID=370345 RepID=A0ABD0KLN0_9CAEN